MKKLLSLMLVLAMLVCLCACGAKPADGAASIVQNNNSNTSDAPEAPQAPEANDDAPASDTTAEEGFVFTYNGVQITMNAPAADILAALGEPKSYTEQASCAFEGLDKTYFFGSFYLQTYPNGDADYIYAIWLVDDTVTTEEGVYIGASQADVEKAYGAENFDGTNSFKVTKGDSSLTVIMDNGAVSSIQYDAVTM